jgi:hypothetical protein
MFKRKEDMKKQYINPELQVIVMKTTGMLANSPIPTATGKPDEWGAHHFTLEDDDDEEDY